MHTDGCELTLFCVHNYDMGTGEMRRVFSVLHELVDEHASVPMHKRDILMGDVNFIVAQAGRVRRGEGRTEHMQLRLWVELPASGSTHVSADRCAFSCIDRVWACCFLARFWRSLVRERVWVHSRSGCWRKA